MIEKIVLDYLLEESGVPTFMEAPPNPPEEHIIIEKMGGSVVDHIKRAVIAVQSYAESLYKAAELNEKVKELLEGMINLDDVIKVELNSDYNYTIASQKQYRYQAVFDIFYY